MGYMPEWIVEVMTFSAKDGEGFDAEHWNTYWTCFGLDSNWIGVIIDLEFRFKDGHIIVKNSARYSPNLTETLSGLLLACWRLVNFCDQRFRTLGDSGASAIRFASSGGGSLVRYTLKNGGSGYHLNGWLKLGVQEMRFFARCALSRFPTDAFLADIQEDDRLVRNLDAVEQNIREELDYIHNIPLSIFETVAEVVDSNDPEELQHDTISGCTAAVCYMNRNALAAARAPPYDLCHGKIPENVQALKGVQRISSNPVKRNITILAKKDWDDSKLVEGIEVMRDLNCSNIQGENQHQPASANARFHSGLSLKTLSGKALLGAAQPIVVRDQGTQAIRQLEARRRHMLARLSESADGRNMFYKVCCDMEKLKSGLDPLPEAVRKEIMREHGKEYSKLSAAAEASWERKAQAYNAEKATELSNAIAGVEAALEQRRADDAAERKKKEDRLLMSNCKLDEAAMQRLTDTCNSSDFSARKIAGLRREAVVPPPVPDEATRQALAKFSVTKPVSSEQPEWASKFCWNRNDCKNAIMRVPNGERRAQYVKFVYASQSPFFIGYEKVSAVSSWEEARDGPTAESDQMNRPWRHKFLTPLMDFIFSEDVPRVPTEQIEVLDNCYFIGRRMLVSNDDWKSLPEFLSQLPVHVPPQRAKNPEKEVKVDPRAQFIRDFPSLANFVPKRKAGGKGGGKDEPVPVPDPPEAEPDPIEFDEGRLAQIFQEVKNYTDEFGLEEQNDGLPVHFKATIRGGAWAVALLNRAVSHFHNEAWSTEAKEFCKEFEVPVSAGFSVKKYGARAAATLSRGWIARMDHVVVGWDLTDRGFDHDELVDFMKHFIESEEFRSLATNCTEKAVVDRIKRIRALFVA
jgi:hypothetical protein